MAVPLPALGLSVRWQTYLASQKAWPELRNVSLKRQISTPCWLRQCSSSSFLPHITSEFLQARRSALPRTVPLGCAAIFGHEDNDGLQAIPRAGCPCGEGRDGREKPTSQFHTCLEGKAIEEISSSGLVGTTRTGVVGLVAADLTHAATFFFDLPVAG